MRTIPATDLRPRRTVRTLALAALLLALTAAGVGASAARLQLTAWPLASRDGEELFANVLRAPADSVGLAAALLRAEALLQGGGWLEARVSAAWSTDRRLLTVRIQPGPRYRWGTLACDVPREDSLALARLLRWPHGAPADPALLGARVDQALRDGEEQGHAWAQLEVTGWELDSARVNVRLSGALGPRVHVSGVRIDGLHTTRRDVAERALGRVSGVPYNPTAARAAAVRLSQLGVFSRAEFAGLEGGPQWQAGTLAYKVQELRYNRFEGAVGVQGSAGVVGVAKLELGNLLGTARSAALGWQSRGAGRSDFDVRYVEPFLAGLPFRMDAALAQQLQDSTYTRTRWGVNLGYALGTGDRVVLGLEEERVVQNLAPAGTADLQNTVFAYERDSRDDQVTPRVGTRLRLSGTGVYKHEVARTPVPGQSPSVHSRAGVVDARAEWHRPTGAATGVALELWAAGRFSSEPILADYERTPVGGATTLRGHNEEEFRVDRVALSRLEYRWFPSSTGEQVALFWDHAHMFTREPVLDPFGQTVGDRGVNQDADGVGLGLRLRTAGGIVDVDYGLAPGRGFREGKIHLRLVSLF